MRWASHTSTPVKASELQAALKLEPLLGGAVTALAKQLFAQDTLLHASLYGEPDNSISVNLQVAESTIQTPGQRIAEEPH